MPQVGDAVITVTAHLARILACLVPCSEDSPSESPNLTELDHHQRGYEVQRVRGLPHNWVCTKLRSAHDWLSRTLDLAPRFTAHAIAHVGTWHSARLQQSESKRQERTACALAMAELVIVLDVLQLYPLQSRQPTHELSASSRFKLLEDLSYREPVGVASLTFPSPTTTFSILLVETCISSVSLRENHLAPTAAGTLARASKINSNKGRAGGGFQDPQDGGMP